MTEKDIFKAMNGINESYVADAAPKDGGKPKFKAFLRYGIVAACLSIAVAIGLIIGLQNAQNGNSASAQKPDRVYGVWFNGYFYEPLAIRQGFEQIFPELSELQGEWKYEIGEDQLGEYIGVFPATDWEGYSEGRAYHWKAYPDYDSIIIAERDGVYTFFISHGDQILGGIRQNADAVITKLGLPDSVLYFTVDDNEEEQISGEDAAYVLCRNLAGKEIYTDHADVSRQKFERWYAEKGDVGVRFENGETVFDSHEIRIEYAKFFGSTIHVLWMTIENGFCLRITFDPEYNYIVICGNYYQLTDTESAAISSAFGI